jgi:hypothetical protein
MILNRDARRRAGMVPRALRQRLLRWASTPPTVEHRLAGLEAAVADLRERLTRVAMSVQDAKRLSNEDANALQFALLDINEIRRDLDGVIDGQGS